LVEIVYGESERLLEIKRLVEISGDWGIRRDWEIGWGDLWRFIEIRRLRD